MGGTSSSLETELPGDDGSFGGPQGGGFGQGEGGQEEMQWDLPQDAGGGDEGGGGGILGTLWRVFSEE